MRPGLTVLLVATAAVAGILLVPVWLGVLILLGAVFVAGWLFPEHPVAVGTVVIGLGWLPGFVVLFMSAGSWFTRYWAGFNPLSFDWTPAYLLVAADLAVNLVVCWGWMVFVAYMGAGLSLRRRIRAAA